MSIDLVSPELYFDDNFNLKGNYANGPVVIFFGRPSCPYCVQAKPEFEAAASTDTNAIYRVINTADPRNQSFMDTCYNAPNVPFKIQGVPHIIGYHNGKFYSNFGGDRTAQNFRKYAAGLGKAPIVFRM